MFKFQLWSDLHLEVTDMKLSDYVPTAPYLFLAGDIADPGSQKYRTLLQSVAPAHSYVFVIAGNHEYYDYSMESANKELKRMCAAIGHNIIFLNNATFDIPDTDIRIAGTTLWSNVRATQEKDVGCLVADYRRITGWSLKRNNAQHAFDVDFIKTEIDQALKDEKVLILLTHHAPLLTGTSHLQYENSGISSAFQTDLSHLMGAPVAMWCFGHTHHCSDQMCGTTRVVSNQRGYSWEDGRFEMSKVFL